MTALNPALFNGRYVKGNRYTAHCVPTLDREPARNGAADYQWPSPSYACEMAAAGLGVTRSCIPASVATCIDLPRRVDTLTPFAKVHAATLTYPAPNSLQPTRKISRKVNDNRSSQDDRLQNIKKRKNPLCRYQSTSRLLPARSSLLQQ